MERGRNGVGENEMWLGEGTRLVRVGGVEGLEKVRSVSELRSREPGGFFIGAFITSPANKVKEFALAAFVDLGVDDLGDLVLHISVDFHRRWRRCYATWDRTRQVRFQHGDMINRMNSAELAG